MLLLNLPSKFSFALLFFLGWIPTLNAQYTLNSLYGNLNDCDTMTRGIYVVWWDNDWNMAADADILLDSMIRYRTDCLNDLGMADPPNPPNGYYYNVYLHRPNDVFPSGWGNGQGTDANGYPFLTLPVGAHNDWVNVAHETFHIFQYSATSPGFAYAGDSQWYIEASANWFAAVRNYNNSRAFLEAESLARLPHVALWLSYDNFPASYPQNWQRYVHQYAMALFLYYLTEEVGVPHAMITSGFFAGTNDLPQEYYFNQLGGTVLRNHFINFAARMTNHFDFLPQNQITVFENEWNTYADPADDNEFLEVFTNLTQVTYRPADSLVTTGWSFNTFKIINNYDPWYLISLHGDMTGSAGSSAYFQVKFVVQNSINGTRFIDMPMNDDYTGDYVLQLDSSDTTAYMIIASMPQMFQNVNQTYSYELSIDQIAIGIKDEFNPAAPKEIARYNLAGQKIQPQDKGVQVIQYEDGTFRKIYR